MKASLVLLLALVAMLCCAVQAEQMEVEGPYEDIQDLLSSAAESAAGLASLDTPGPPRVVEVHHNHHHLIPHDMPIKQAVKFAHDNTPASPPVRVVALPNAEQAARHAAEDAEHAYHLSTPSVTTVDVQHTVSVKAAPKPLEYTIKGQRGDGKEDEAWRAEGSGFHFPLVDRGLKRPTFPVIADLDGSEQDPKRNFQPHTAKELQAEAKRLLQKAKELRSKKKDSAKTKKAEQEALGVFDSRDANYEDEMTRLKRVSARMNRLLEQIQTPHSMDTFEGSIARKKYFLKIYKQLKEQAVAIIEAYALRTGNSIFAASAGNKGIDPSIAAFLPPNSVAAILAQYANPTRSRDDETPRDIISGRDAKRIQWQIDYYNAKKNGQELPKPPMFASDIEAALNATRAAAQTGKNKQQQSKYGANVVATQQGDFGDNRPVVTAGNAANPQVGRSSVHIAVVNPTETQDVRGLPYQVNLKLRQMQEQIKQQ